MLVDFTVTNYRSIREPVSLSLVSSSGTELRDTNVHAPDASATPDVVRSAAIYGPNASGKSNLVRAMRTMQRIVLESSNQRQSKEELPLVPFRLDQHSRDEPTEFEVTFVNEGVRFQYGFSATAKMVISEWLLAYPKGRPQRWIDRTYNEITDSYDWGASDKLSGQKQTWQTATRSNALFLSTAIQLNSKQLEPVYDWFAVMLHVVDHGRLSPNFSAKICSSTGGCTAIAEFLRAADTDIEKVQVETKKFDSTSLASEMPDALRAEIQQQLEDTDIHDIQTGHRLDNGDVVYFDLEDESEGTQKIFSLAGPWLDTIENGYVLFIDELHESLHPLIVDFLVGFFHSRANKKGAQLVFTTHDTSILNQKTLRRDQIWFVEKDDVQVTKLYPLSDFRPRKDVENIEKSYLCGRYGALPYLKSIDISDASLDR